MNLVILDRDGVINEDSDDYIKSPDEWVAIPNSLKAIARLNHANIQVVVATNQSGIARKLFDINTLNNIHQKLHQSLSEVGGHLDGIIFCPHGPDEGCHCRKPQPGMLEEIAQRFHGELTEVYFIGDSLKDIQAAQAVDAQALLVKTGKGLKTLATKSPELDGLPVFDDLSQAVDYLLTVQTEKGG